MEVVRRNYLRLQFSLVRSRGEHRAINLYTRFVRARKSAEKTRYCSTQEQMKILHTDFAG